jgi:DNA-binding response OmpR family regulator
MKKKILVVDDGTGYVLALKMRLEASNYGVITAFDGKEAIEKLEKFEPDLAILDLRLPKISGHKVCKHIKTTPSLSKIPVIIMTGSPKIDEKVKSLGVDRADAYFQKPFNIEELLSKIKELTTT